MSFFGSYIILVDQLAGLIFSKLYHSCMKYIAIWKEHDIESDWLIWEKSNYFRNRFNFLVVFNLIEIKSKSKYWLSFRNKIEIDKSQGEHARKKKKKNKYKSKYDKKW